MPVNLLNESDFSEIVDLTIIESPNLATLGRT